MQDRPTLTMYIEAASVALLAGALNLLYPGSARVFGTLLYTVFALLSQRGHDYGAIGVGQLRSEDRT
jgi:hypothetical protein